MLSKILLAIILLLTIQISAQNQFEKDIIKTSAGDLEITFIGHGTLMFTFNGIVIHVDPYNKLAEYSTLPKADIIFITHHHGDHFDPEAIKKIRKENTTVILTELCAEKFEGGTIMKNGDVKTIGEIQIEAVPAYNLVHMRESGEPFHIKGTCNGYVITFGEKRVYVAGDTENTPEMKALEDIDIAFLPMNLPYTMTPEMVADAAKAFKPKILYPYHFGETDVSKIVDLMKDEKEIEVRVRKMK
ncbi:MAG TPA: MBL fold metallo-hydrolase [Ignavibacteriaceae bacterium]|jgi:L-ascorbate metabolism protein UlaG (beta-lactamase superfamily)